MQIKSCWLLYEDHDYARNRDFAALLMEEGISRGIFIEPTLTSQLVPVMRHGQPQCLRNGLPERPDLVISRQRDSFLSAHFERMGIPVYNNARVCAIANDKRRTHRFLWGLPMLNSFFLSNLPDAPPPGTSFPTILKPAGGHGGDRVFWVQSREEWDIAATQIAPGPMIQQEIASDYGRDLRIYIVFEQIVAAVMRTAKSGFLANYKQGGQISLHSITPEERALAEQVIARFGNAHAPLCFAGIDLLYHHGRPVVSEVEDVVGSRMLYQVSDINIAALYLEKIQQDLQSENDSPRKL